MYIWKHWKYDIYFFNEISAPNKKKRLKILRLYQNLDVLSMFLLCLEEVGLEGQQL